MNRQTIDRPTILQPTSRGHSRWGFPHPPCAGVSRRRRASIREKIKNKEVLAGVKKDDAVRAQLEKIKAERAVARAKEAAKKAKDKTIEVAGF